MNYTDKFPTSMKTGGMKKAQKGGSPQNRNPYLQKGPYKIKKGPKVDPLAPNKPKIKKVPKSEALQNLKKGGFPDLTGDGKVTRADVLKGRGVFKSGGSKGLPKKQLGGVMRAIEKKPLPKIGGRTTTGVVNNYQGYKAPVAKKQIAKVKKGKGKL